MTEIAASKNTLRGRLLAARRELGVAQRAAAAERIAAQVSQLPEISAGSTVAAYVSVGSEPGTAPTLDLLQARGIVVLLPVLRPDHDLDWARYEGRAGLGPGSRGLLEPRSGALGVDAVTEARLVLAPGLAVDRAGRRLGRGGGSYDRVLARLDDPGRVAVILYRHEIIDHVPTDEHDRPVGAAITPEGVLRFQPAVT